MKWLVTAKEMSESTQRYIDWLKRADIEGRVILPEEEIPDTAHRWAALLLTGGGDVEPSLYNEPNAPQTDDVSTARDSMELRLIERFLKAKKPIFGICRGQQIINVALGGKLIQHLPPQQLPTHKASQQGDIMHAIRWNTESMTASQIGEALEVNSAHHQAIDPESVGGGLTVSAWAVDGVIEAVEGIVHGSHIRAVQWHPERMQPQDHMATQGLLEYWIQIVAS
jgi:putative glutamine amidotransferase